MTPMVILSLEIFRTRSHTAIAIAKAILLKIGSQHFYRAIYIEMSQSQLLGFVTHFAIAMSQSLYVNEPLLSSVMA